MKLRTAVFSALANVIRADGVVTPEEREGLLAATRAAGANEAEVIRAIEGRVPTMSEWCASLALTFDERIFVYAAAVWLARLDGTVTSEETDTVRKLGEALSLSESDRVLAALAAANFSASADRTVLGLAHAIEQQIQMTV